MALTEVTEKRINQELQLASGGFITSTPKQFFGQDLLACFGAYTKENDKEGYTPLQKVGNKLKFSVDIVEN